MSAKHRERNFIQRHTGATLFSMLVIIGLVIMSGVLVKFFNVPQPQGSALPVVQITAAPSPAMNMDRDLLAAKATALETTPPKFPTTYTVVSNDYLYKIAQAEYGNGNDWTFIYYANKLTSTTIYPGKILIIPAPNGSPPAPPTPVITVVAAATPSTPGVTVSGPSGSFEACVMSRESGGNPKAYNSSSGASGLYGFLLSTWLSLPASAGYPGGAYTAPVSVQEEAFQEEYTRSGTSPWAPYDGC